jgi:hypothetical protein
MLAFSRTRQLGSVAAIAVLSLAAALAAQTPQQTPRWKTFSYPADGFTASWPSEPAMSRQNVPTDTGTFELRSYLVDNDPVGMMVGVCDYGAAAAGRDPDSVLQGARNGALQNTKTNLLRERKIALGENHGVEFESENDTLHLTVRVYLVGTRLYQVLVGYPISTPFKDAARFLDSFQLIPRTSN